MTVYTILKEYTWLVNTIHHAGIRTQGQESCDSNAPNFRIDEYDNFQVWGVVIWTIKKWK